MTRTNFKTAVATGKRREIQIEIPWTQGLATGSGRSIIVLCQCILLCGLFTTRTARADRLPNVVIIYTDDQGFGDAGCLNPESKFDTPNLDRIAREGISFTDAHSSDTVCTPSRYGLLTGRYSWRTTLKRGVFGAEQKGLIEDGRMTIATLLLSLIHI